MARRPKRKQPGPTSNKDKTSKARQRERLATPPPLRRSPRGHKTPDYKSGLCKSEGVQLVATPNARLKDRRAIPSYVRSGRIEKTWPKTIRQPHSKMMPGTLNNCYRIALWQCLLHVPAIYNFLGKIHHDCPLSAASCVACALQALCEYYWNHENSNTINDQPKGVIETLNAALEANIDPTVDYMLEQDFRTKSQSDPALLLQYMLREIKQWDERRFDEVFGLKVLSRWVCEDCNSVHRSEETSGDEVVRVGIRDPQRGLSLVEYLDYCYFQQSVQVRCEADDCPGKRNIDRLKQFRIEKAPLVLKIKLERAYLKDMDFWGSNGVKEGAEVPFDEFLDLSTYTESGELLVYRLDAVVAHIGKSFDHGHYIAAVREQGKRSFCSINMDAELARHRGGLVQELKKPFTAAANVYEGDADPYMLLYTRVTP